MTPGPGSATPPDDQAKEDFKNEVRRYLSNKPVDAVHLQIPAQYLHNAVTTRIDQAKLSLNDRVYYLQGNLTQATGQSSASNAATVDDAVTRFIMESEGASGVQNGIPEVYGFRQNQNDGYAQIMEARNKYGKGSPEEFAVVKKLVERHAHQAGADQFADPGVRAAVMSLAHMRGVGGAHAILNAMAANDPNPLYSASALDADAAKKLNGLTPREFQDRLRKFRWNYDEQHYGTKNNPKDSRSHFDPDWKKYEQGLINRYDNEQREFLRLSPNPDAVPNPID
jgi:hypothetical protein